jgi:hypothetical protein
MTDDHASHLDEAQVLVSLVDEDDLPAAARSHLAVCPACMAARQRHANRLQRLAELAREAVPAPSRRVTLPREGRTSTGGKPYPRWSLAWKPAFALAAVALVVITLGTLQWKSGQEGRLAGLNRELQDDRVLITEVQRLETDALPSLYAAIAGDDDVDVDEDQWDWMVPDTEDDTLSGRGASEPGGKASKTEMTLSLLDRPVEMRFLSL